MVIAMDQVTVVSSHTLTSAIVKLQKKIIIYRLHQKYKIVCLIVLKSPLNTNQPTRDVALRMFENVR